MTHTVEIGDIKIANDRPLAIIAGPCQMESREHALECAEALAGMCKTLDMPFIFKTSFDKANRTSASGKRGVGLEKAIPVFKEVSDKIGCPVLTDVHEPWQCAELQDAVDVLQIPAFLCRQTDLLLAAAKTGCVVNVKKGQFLAPWDMKNVVGKVEEGGCNRIMLTERGTSFGYNTLVTDMRGLPIMAQTQYPIVFDATHSVQQPGGQGTSSGGQREFAPVLARAAVSLGIAAVFIEAHEDPDTAPSDGANMIALRNMPDVLAMLKAFDQLAKANPIRID